MKINREKIIIIGQILIGPYVHLIICILSSDLFVTNQAKIRRKHTHHGDGRWAMGDGKRQQMNLA
jgi:hypothetical protein